MGNVGQMAADLLISSLYLIKAGDLYTSDVLPAVGNDPFGATRSTPSSCQLSTSVEGINLCSVVCNFFMSVE